MADFADVMCMADLLRLYRENPRRYRLWDEQSKHEYLLYLYRCDNG